MKPGWWADQRRALRSIFHHKVTAHFYPGNSNAARCGHASRPNGTAVYDDYRSTQAPACGLCLLLTAKDAAKELIRGSIP